MKYLSKISIVLFIFLSTVPVSAQWLYGKAAIGNKPVSISGNLNLKSGGELYLQTGTLNLTGNYNGESGSEIYLTVSPDTHGFMNISGTATNATEIIPDIFPAWDGTRIDFVKARQNGSFTGAFLMEDIPANDYVVQLKYEQQGNELIWYIEKTEINRCLPLIVQLGNHTLLVNNNSATNGGYKFVYYYWYKDGILIKEDSHAGNGGSYYTGGAALDAGTDYTAEVVDDAGNHHFSCPYRYVPTTLPMTVTAYPNPVQRNVMAYIQVETPDLSLLEEATVDIYDTLGQHIGTSAVSGQTLTPLYMPSKTGIYILKFKAKDYVTNIKLMVE